ncbi:MAG: methionine adenosyltransferase [Bdellovibrionales bacterium]
MMKDFLFSSESVSEGHPDKVADQISDAVLDAYLTQDPKSRVACETMISTGFVVVAGEITSKGVVDIPTITRKTIEEIGYDDVNKGFDFKHCAIFSSLDRQSPDIAMGVDDHQHEQGAGDQGLMFGYACNETAEFMPMSLSLSHKLVKNLSVMRKKNTVNWLRPDAKSQVTVQYVDGKIKRVEAVVLSTQHSPDVTQNEIKAFITEELIQKAIPKELIDAKTKFFVNPTGRFVVGGPHGDCGLTGRKIIVDTYGGHGAHGGGAFSGKDPSKVDRSAAYAARHIAKNIVAAGLVDRCLVQIAYAIGVAEPVSVMVEDYGTAKVDVKKINNAVREIWNLKPASILKRFDLLRPIYRPTAAYGHFGRDEANFTWEKLDQVDALKSLC